MRFRLRFSTTVFAFALLLISLHCADQQRKGAALSAEPRQADEVFRKWKTWQFIYTDERIDRPSFEDPLKALQAELPKEFRSRAAFLGLASDDFDLTANPARSDEQKKYKEANQRLQKGLAEIAVELDHDMPAFARRLDRGNFSSKEINEAEKAAPTKEISAAYRHVLEAIMHASEQDHEQKMFALGNRLFEFAFGEKTGPEFVRLLDRPEKHPLVRLFYATIWYRLSGNGWRIWHRSTLDALKRETDFGKEVVYIAGGTDFYHLIKAGVRRIRIIDPILPSQIKYYSEGWEFLVSCTAGDEITFPDEKLTLRRKGCKELGTFQTGELSDGTKKTLPLTIVEWKILDDRGRLVGYVTYERRFAKQDDFKSNPDRVLLISFNELAYVTDGTSSGWGMDPEKWAGDVKIYVKQLRHALSRSECVNLKKASTAPFSFIRLGTSVL